MEEIIATHIVKPSSPTPTHLKTVKLSSLDLLSPALYVPLIFFYDNHNHESTETISQRLRQSLSETLSMFYPLAGTLRQHSFIECDDGGAEFVEARLHYRLSQLTQHPHEMEKLEKLIPMQSYPHKDDLLLSAKATYFDCGGVAIGVCFSHKIADAASCTMFMNAWAATCRGEASGITPPSFDLAQHFPLSPVNLSSLSGFIAEPTEETMVRRRLVFEREKVEKIRKQVAGWSDEVKDPSTVEALSALIWRSFIQAYKSRHGPTQETTSYMANLSVNLRPRAAPPIPDRTFGNCLSVVSAVVSGGGEAEESGVHVSKLRAAVRGVNGDYINSFIKHSEFLSRALASITGISKPENLFITSWWRFPIYEADFGWGKPVWICPCNMRFKNGVFLMSTPSGDGMEMWINLPDEEFFQMFQTNCKNLLLP